MAERRGVRLAYGWILLLLASMGCGNSTPPGEVSPGGGSNVNLRVTDENFKKIERGMHLREVETLLGEGEHLFPNEVPDDLQKLGRMSWTRWRGETHTIYIGEGSGADHLDERVHSKAFVKNGDSRSLDGEAIP